MPRDRALIRMMTFTVALFAAVALGGAVQAGPADGLIGQPLAVAQTNEFFTWFHLVQTASQPCGDGQALGFRPDGEQFRRVVAVEVMTDARGDIAVMTLMLDRAFIDDSVNGCGATIKVRTPDNQGEKMFCRLRRREGGALPERKRQKD